MIQAHLMTNNIGAVRAVSDAPLATHLTSQDVLSAEHRYLRIRSKKQTNKQTTKQTNKSPLPLSLTDYPTSTPRYDGHLTHASKRDVDLDLVPEGLQFNTPSGVRRTGL